MHNLRIEVLITIVCVLCVAAPARAQDEPPPVNLEPVPSSTPSPEDEAEFMTTLLEKSAKDTKKARTFLGVSGLAGGASLLTLGIIRMVQDPGNNQIQRGVGLMWLGAGAAGLAGGLVLVTRKSPEEGILRRWNTRRLREEPLSEWELGSYAGELRAAAAFRKRERNLVRWTSLAGAASGALALALIPADNNLDDESRRNVIVIGSIFLGIGLINFGFSFRVSGTEKAWDEYQKSPFATRRGVKLSIAPSMYKQGGGVSLVGRF